MSGTHTETRRRVLAPKGAALCDHRSMRDAGAFAVVVAGVLALAGCVNETAAPTETVTVIQTASPRPAVAVTETVAPSVYVPLGEFAILVGEGATRDDAALAAAFVEFALDSSTVPEGLTFAPGGVQLGILQRIFVTRAPSELRDPSAWQIGTEDDLYFERSGPFSAIEPVRQWVVGRDAESSIATGAFEVAVGQHEGCSYPVEGLPAGMESARQVWLKPVGEYISCADGWFAVDLFVIDNAVVAVTIGIGAP